MGKIGFNVDVNDADIADRVESRIEDGIENSISPRKPNSLGHKIKKAMREHIRRHGRVWTTELLNSFEIDADTSGATNILIIRNDADHATPIDLGATYGDEGPPLHKLIPWVESKLKGYRARGGALVKYKSDDGGKTILTDGSGKRRGATLDLPPDLEVENVTPLTEMEDVSGSSKSISYHVEFTDGQEAFFQQYIEPDMMAGASTGTVRNESVFTRLSSEEDWRLAPENRAGNIIDPGNDELVRGNFQRWVDDSTDAAIEISSPEADYGARWTPPEFLNENREQLARMTVLDILIGNEDRHMENIRVDSDGNIHAIDNGGNYLKYEGSIDDLIRYNSVATASVRFNKFDDYPELEDAYQQLFERQLELLESFLEDHREDILTHTRLIHGKNSPVYSRMEKLLDHSNEEILSQVEAHQQDMLDSRRVSTEDIDRVLEEADDLEDAEGILGDIADSMKDL